MERHQVYLRGADPSGPQTVQVLGLPPVSLDLLTVHQACPGPVLTDGLEGLRLADPMGVYPVCFYFFACVRVLI